MTRPHFSSQKLQQAVTEMRTLGKNPIENGKECCKILIEMKHRTSFSPFSQVSRYTSLQELSLRKSVYSFIITSTPMYKKSNYSSSPTHSARTRWPIGQGILLPESKTKTKQSSHRLTNALPSASKVFIRQYSEMIRCIGEAPQWPPMPRCPEMYMRSCNSSSWFGIYKWLVLLK